MRHYNRSQIDQGEVLDDCCYMTFALVASALKVTLFKLPSFLNASSAKHGSHLLKKNLK